LEKEIKLHLNMTVGKLSEKKLHMLVWYTNMCFCCSRQYEVIFFVIVRYVALIAMYKSESCRFDNIYLPVFTVNSSRENCRIKRFL
jgi:hypothetical protein